MTTLTREEAINLGGKIWTKDSLERIYLSLDAINKLRVANGYAEILSPSKKMKEAKTFLDCKTNELRSDVGMIRSSLCSIGFDCKA